MVVVTKVQQPTIDQLDAAWSTRISSPCDRGTIEMIVARPGLGRRSVLDRAELVVGQGLVGDNYLERGDRHQPDGAAHPEAQLNLMNCRAVDLVSGGDRERWPLAGDQFFVDLDLSVSNAPPGTRFAIGDAVVEVSQKPHNGCSKFAERFGIDAARWVNQVKDERRRGLNAMVVRSGTVRTGDPIRKLP